MPHSLSYSIIVSRGVWCFFVKGRSKCDADPWWLGGGQRRRVLPTRKRVSEYFFLLVLYYVLSILPSGTTWWTTQRSLYKATVWWPPNTDTPSMLDWQSEYQTNHLTNTKYGDIKTHHQCRDRGAAAELGRCARLGGTLRSRSGSSGIGNTLKRVRLLSGKLQPLPRPRLPGPQGADEEAAARRMVRPQLTFWRTLSLLRASWHSLWSGDCFLEIDIEIACACSSLLYLYSRQTGQKQTTENKIIQDFFQWYEWFKLVFFIFS